MNEIVDPYYDSVQPPEKVPLMRYVGVPFLVGAFLAGAGMQTDCYGVFTDNKTVSVEGALHPGLAPRPTELPAKAAPVPVTHESATPTSTALPNQAPTPPTSQSDKATRIDPVTKPHKTVESPRKLTAFIMGDSIADGEINSSNGGLDMAATIARDTHNMIEVHKDWIDGTGFTGINSTFSLTKKWSSTWMPKVDVIIVNAGANPVESDQPSGFCLSLPVKDEAKRYCQAFAEWIIYVRSLNPNVIIVKHNIISQNNPEVNDERNKVDIAVCKKAGIILADTYSYFHDRGHPTQMELDPPDTTNLVELPDNPKENLLHPKPHTYAQMVLMDEAILKNIALSPKR
jgi:hypothetical protein